MIEQHHMNNPHSCSNHTSYKLPPQLYHHCPTLTPIHQKFRPFLPNLSSYIQYLTHTKTVLSSSSVIKTARTKHRQYRPYNFHFRSSFLSKNFFILLHYFKQLSRVIHFLSFIYSATSHALSRYFCSANGLNGSQCASKKTFNNAVLITLD